MSEKSTFTEKTLEKIRTGEKSRNKSVVVKGVTAKGAMARLG